MTVEQGIIIFAAGVGVGLVGGLIILISFYGLIQFILIVTRIIALNLGFNSAIRPTEIEVRLKKRRLQKLREKKAILGIYADPSIDIEIEELQKWLYKNKRRIKEYTYNIRQSFGREEMLNIKMVIFIFIIQWLPILLLLLIAFYHFPLTTSLCLGFGAALMISKVLRDKIILNDI